MNLEKINELSAQLSEAKKALASAVNAYEVAKKVKSGGTQTGISVNVGGLSFKITEMDRGYMERVIRGHEMIYLGVLKVLYAREEACRDRVAWIENEMRAEMMREATTGSDAP